jgi:peptidoglycan/LPS O-acetylase OafA/YrhL
MPPDAPLLTLPRSVGARWRLASVAILAYAILNLVYSLQFHHDYPDATPSFLLRAVVRTTLATLLALALFRQYRMARWVLIGLALWTIIGLVVVLVSISSGKPAPLFSGGIGPATLMSAFLVIVAASCLLRLPIVNKPESTSAGAAGAA